MRTNSWIALAFLAPTLSACFDPSVPDQLTCGSGGECPQGQRCEVTIATCVPSDQASLAALRFVQEPAKGEALASYAPIDVEFLDAAGQRVPMSGARMTIALDPGGYGTGMSGDAVSTTFEGVARFAGLVFDSPARRIRLVATLGPLQATSEPFDVTPSRPQVSGLETTDAEGCATLHYRVAQAQGLPVDVLVEVDPDGPAGPAGFQRAHQGASDSGSTGVARLPVPPSGRDATFTWSSTSDVPGDADAVLRISASLDGLAGDPVTSGPVHVHNGLRWTRHDEAAAGISGVHTVDFDGDGWSDAIAWAGSVITVRYGNSSSTYEVDAGSPVSGLATADFDLDGFVDVAVATDGGGVKILYQRRPGAAPGPRPQISGPDRVQQVLAEDLDRDGRPDLVVVDASTGDVSVQRNSGSSGFSLWATPWTGGDTGSVALGKWRNGDFELVVGHSAGPVTVVPMTAGVFGQPYAIVDLVGRDVSAADFDGDAFLDTAALAPDGVRIHAGGPMVGPVPGTQAARTMMVVDLNHDARPDLLLATDHGLLALVHAPVNAVQFLPPVLIDATEEASALAVADMDRDGRLDVLAASTATGTLTTFTDDTSRRCLARLRGPVGSALGFAPSAVADIDADGKPDLVSATTSYASGRGDGSFSLASYDLPDQSTLHGPIVTDVDADGAADVAYLSGTSEGFVNIAFNDPLQPARFRDVVQVATLPDAQQLWVGDFDADGRPDLLVRNDSRLQVLFASRKTARAYQAAEPFPAVIPPCVPPGECRFGLADLDGDGRAELFVQNAAALMLFRPDPAQPGQFLPPVTANVGDGHLLVVGNVVGDHADELLFRSSLNGTESPEVLVGYGLTASNQLEPIWWARTGSDIRAAVVDDLDGDGHADMAVQLRDSVEVFSPDTVPLGASVPRQHTIYVGDASSPRDQLRLRDLDGDGHDDLLVDGSIFVRGLGGLDFDGGSFVAPIGKRTGRVAVGHYSGSPQFEMFELGDGTSSFWYASSDTSGRILTSSGSSPTSWVAATTRFTTWTETAAMTSCWAAVPPATSS